MREKAGLNGIWRTVTWVRQDKNAQNSLKLQWGKGWAESKTMKQTQPTSFTNMGKKRISLFPRNRRLPDGHQPL